MQQCTDCRELKEKVEQTLSILDKEVTVPDTLAASIVSRTRTVEPRAPRRLGFITYIQVAAAVFFGIFIGHQFGKYAGPVERSAATDPVHQYFKAHHLQLDHSDFTTPTLFNLNKHD